MVRFARLIRHIPTEAVAAARKASFGQVVSCIPGKNNQAIIPVSNVFVRKVRGGQRSFTALGGIQSEHWLQVERDLPQLIGRWRDRICTQTYY